MHDDSGRVIARIWLRARNVRLGIVLLTSITIVTSVFSNSTIPTPFAFLRSASFEVPFGSLAPVATVMAVGYLLYFQSPGIERASVRPIALLDAGLLSFYSALLVIPATVWLVDNDAWEIIAACRVQLFAFWIVLIGSHIVGTRLSVACVTTALILAPTFLPSHLRNHPPGIFVTLAKGNSLEATGITIAVVFVGLIVIAIRGLPQPA